MKNEMGRKIILSDNAEMFLDGVYGSEDIKDLQLSFFPKYILKDLTEGLEFCANLEDDFPALTCFLAGIDYQKNKSRRGKA